MRRTRMVVLALAAALSLPLAAQETDRLIIGEGVVMKGGVVRVPIYLADAPGTALGSDREAARQIAGIAFKVLFTPPDAVASASVDRTGAAGLLTHLEPVFESASFKDGSVSYIASFPEIRTDASAGSGGQKLCDLLLTFAPKRSQDVLLLAFDRKVTALSDISGVMTESAATGTLVLANGAVKAPRERLPRKGAPLASAVGGRSSAESLTSKAPRRAVTDSRVGTNAHSGSSPFDPLPEGDTTFFVDSGSGLDTGCTYRTGGPLLITLKNKRFVGAVNADGTLQNPATLVSRGLLGAKAHLRLPAYDIDVNGAPGYPPEVDAISFNGHSLGTLTGNNEVWKLNEFDVPIDWVKFPAASSPGSDTVPADNVIRIDIDQASGTFENWCMAIDWVTIEYQAIAPIFLVHGTNAQSDSWDGDFFTFFTQNGSPWSRDINMEKNGSILGNANLLSRRVLALARSFGAKKAHLIAHSKGGNDSRGFLGRFYDPKQLKILSLYTLSTPFQGTIIADITLAGRTREDPTSSSTDIAYLIDHDYWFLDTPQEPALRENTTTNMATFNATTPFPAGVKFYSYAANADLNANGTIEAPAETTPLMPSTWGLQGTIGTAATAMYRVLGTVGSVTVTRQSDLWGLNEWTEIEVGTATPFRQNDLVVTAQNATAPGGTHIRTLSANHSSMKSTATAQEIVDRIKQDFPIQ